MRTAICAAGIATLVAVISWPVRADPRPSFEGGYIGLNAGAAWGSSRYETDPGCPGAAASATFCGAAPDPSVVNGIAVGASGTGNLSSTGFTGGAQAGYNWQSGSIVYGGEGDFGAFDLGDSIAPIGVFPFAFLGTTYALTERMSTDWLATLRARLGFAVMPALLLYATGGLAFTDFKFSSSYADNAVSPLFPGGTGFGSKSGVRIGWTVGGGVEWLLHADCSIKAEYLYVGFGSQSIAVPTSNTAAFTQTMHVNADLNASLARIGLNFGY